MVALSLWQRMLAQGPAKFGEVYYLGTAPMRGREPALTNTVEVLVGTFDVVECRFMFDRDSGHLVGLETWPDPDADPCEIYFSDYAEVNGQVLPTTLQVWHGDDIFTTLKIKSANIPPAAETEA